MCNIGLGVEVELKCTLHLLPIMCDLELSPHRALLRNGMEMLVGLGAL